MARQPTFIDIQGARVNTLKNISCRIPQGRLTVITGPSGSGKSSLAFDTLYAEGQRRFIESMSPYARQFFERIPRPDVDAVHHILPAIALEQKNRIKNARSTVGTATDVDDYLRMLFAHAGTMMCPHCNQPVTCGNLGTIAHTLATLPEASKTAILAFLPAPNLPVVQTQLVSDLCKLGYTRLMAAEGQIIDIKANSSWQKDWLITLEPLKGYWLAVLVDRFRTGGSQSAEPDQSEAAQGRVIEALEAGQTLLNALHLGGQEGLLGFKVLEQNQPYRAFLPRFACQNCLIAYSELSAERFSFNHPQGACPTCEGFGRVMGIDWQKVIPNHALSLEEGAIHPFSTPSNQQYLQDWLEMAQSLGIQTHIPFGELSAEAQALIKFGQPPKHGSVDTELLKQFESVSAYFKYLDTKRYKVHVRITIARYRGYTQCPDCEGSRLNAEARQVVLLCPQASESTPQNLAGLSQLPLSHLFNWLNAYSLPPALASLQESILSPLRVRVGYLVDIGLGYLTLARQSRTLSGGESQRIHLATALGSKLTETLYVLDEPTIGLHPRDTRRLLAVMKSLRDHGNTVVVVEHDPDIITGADCVLELGPASGDAGGQLMFAGSVKALSQDATSLTAQWIWQHPASTDTKNTKTPDLAPACRVQPSDDAAASKAAITIHNARGQNLKNLTVAIPKNKLVVVSGVSGSGKSTLVSRTLFPVGLLQRGQSVSEPPEPVDFIEGLEDFSQIVMVDQSPPQRSSRSNPATFVKAFDDIRALFAATRQAKALGLSAADFSFNGGDGRCLTCEGLGSVTIDMQFLADVVTPCPDCEGRRFGPQVLSVGLGNWQGEAQTIDNILQMTVDSAVTFLKNGLSAGEFQVSKTGFSLAEKAIARLHPLQTVGLGYLRLGQQTATLSGGEAQRLKLVSYLGGLSEKSEPVLFIFDEPTTGLHLSDVDRLVGVLKSLICAGHSVIVVEHHLGLMAQADWIIDLGPDGGSGGGHIVAQGTVADVMANPASVTGPYLAETGVPL
ncbi:MAG: excinuclease ABC subunit UvrA [Vampirovibrionales bacterium]|nr:excinuclease ABC subunit UvrA [Vampirovibrionales bacterium]